MGVLKSVGAILLVVFAGVTGLLLGERIQAAKPARAVDTAAAPLPKDVNPDSLNRLPLIKREDMDDYGKKVFDEQNGPVSKSWSGGRAALRLYSPRLAKSMADAHTYLKFESGLGDRLTEIAVLTTARAINHQFEWTQWEIHGRMDGSFHVEPEIIDIIKFNKPVVGLGEKETVIINFGRELFGKQKVSSETFAHALRLFGPRGVVDLTNLMAIYNATALEMDAFDQHLLPGQEPMLPQR